MKKIYRNVLLNSTQKYCLIAKIKGLSNEGKVAHRKFLKDVKKNEIWNRRRLVIAEDVRHYLLAYAFMRGVPYSVLEAKCRPDNRPMVNVILKIVHAHLPVYQTSLWTEDRAIKWLKGEVI